MLLLIVAAYFIVIMIMIMIMIITVIIIIIIIIIIPLCKQKALFYAMFCSCSKVKPVVLPWDWSCWGPNLQQQLRRWLE